MSILIGCSDENEENSRPVINFWSKIYFEDQRINDSIAGLEKDIDYSVGKWSDPYTGGNTIETKKPLNSLYTIDCTFDNGADEIWGCSFLRFDTDELSEKSYIILTSHLMAPIQTNKKNHDVIYQLCSKAMFGGRCP